MRQLRRERGLTQAQLGQLAGVSRQLVGALEAGRHLPRVDAAVGLARALATSVEDLLAAAPGGAVGVLADPSEGALVRLARVGDLRVCIPAGASGEGWAAADAVVRGGSVELFGTERPAAVVAGCDPAIGLTAGLVEAAAGPRVLVVATSSAAAITTLASGRSHAVIVHGRAGTLPEAPVPVRRFDVARWQVGLAAPADLPAGWVEDALAGRVPVIQREPGAGTQAAFERAVAACGSTDPASVEGPRAAGHAEAAWRCATDGLVAVTIEPAALAMNLAFHPLEVHVSELWIAVEHLDHAGVRAFVDELTGDRVRRRLDAIGGYDLTDSGTPNAA
ncbi:MAG TPA: substrate-binding domain-containing protein [Nitriliruptorales bacterium]